MKLQQLGFRFIYNHTTYHCFYLFPSFSFFLFFCSIVHRPKVNISQIYLYIVDTIVVTDDSMHIHASHVNASMDFRIKLYICAFSFFTYTQTCSTMRMYVDVSMDWQICTYLSISGQDIIRREKCVNSQARMITFQSN